MKEKQTFDRASHVIVDDERHIFDVNTTASHISSHHDVLGAPFDTCQRVLSLLLAFTTVQCSGVELLQAKRSQGQSKIQKK